MVTTPWWKKAGVILVYAIAGWMLCSSVIFIGRSVTTMDNTLIVHAISVPIIISMLSSTYFRYFHYTAPLPTAAIFVAVPFLLDFFVIAPFVEKSYAMFASVLGTWLPFCLIFLTTYFSGLYVTRPRPVPVA